jgi:hypothetical protein
MSAIVVAGDTSGSVTLNAPSVSGATVITLPTTSGTMLTNKSAGTVLQVVSTTKSNTFSTTSSSFVDITGMSATITPTSATSKIYVVVSIASMVDATTSWFGGSLRLVRDSTPIAIGDAAGSATQASVVAGGYSNQPEFSGSSFISYLDSPATTSATTYKMQAIHTQSRTVRINTASGDETSATYGARYSSTITLWEIAA